MIQSCGSSRLSIVIRPNGSNDVSETKIVITWLPYRMGEILDTTGTVSRGFSVSSSVSLLMH